MKTKVKLLLLISVMAGAGMSTGCGKVASKIGHEVEKNVNETAGVANSVSGASTYKWTLADGPAACLGAYQKKIGQDFNIWNLCTTPQIIAEQRTISNYPISFFIIRNKKAVCCLIYPWNSQNQGEITLKSTFQADLGCDCCSTNLAVFRLWIK